MSRMFAVLGALSVALAAIWTNAQSVAQTKPPPTAIRVVALPIANFTPLLVARDKGYFADENLSVTWTNVAQGGVAIQAVFGGSAEIGGSATFETMVARSHGLDLTFIADGVHIHKHPPDNSALLVRTDGSVRTAADLVGKKVSVGLIDSINYVHMLAWLEKHKVDPKKVQFLEIPFPQMADALFQKRVEAVWNVEPFVTFMTRTGKAKVLAYPYLETLPGMDIVAYFAKESWIKSHPALALGFRRAIDRATTDVATMSKEDRDNWVAKFTGMKPDLVKHVTLPVFTTQYDIPSLQANIELGVKYKMISKSFDVKTMIWKP
jgi:NitT/TauT family transport system substrate-binding protein